MKLRGSKKIYAMISLIVMVAIFVSACGVLGTGKKVGKDVAAVVDGKEISVQEFNVIFNIYKMIYELEYGKEIWDKQMDGKDVADYVKGEALEMAVRFNVAALRSAKEGIQIEEELFVEEYNDWLSFLGEDGKHKEVLEGYGVTEEGFKNFIRQTLVLRTYLQDFAQTVVMTDKEVKEYYDNTPQRFNMEQVKASHILLDTEEEALKILDLIQQGKDFGDLAVEFSTEEAAQYTKGSLGYFHRERMIKEFSDAAFALQVGEISKPVKTEHGYHIIKLEDKRTSIPFEDIKEQLKQDSYAFEHVLFNRLKKGYKIFTYPENI